MVAPWGLNGVGQRKRNAERKQDGDGGERVGRMSSEEVQSFLIRLSGKQVIVPNRAGSTTDGNRGRSGC